MMSKITRYVLPTLIVFFCLPSAALGLFWLTGLISSHFVQNRQSDPFLVILQIMCGLIMTLFHLQVPVELAGALWICLLVAGQRIVTKVWTAAVIMIAIYGLYVFSTQFQMH